MLTVVLRVYHYWGREFGRFLNSWANGNFVLIALGLLLALFTVQRAAKKLPVRQRTMLFLSLITAVGALLRLNGLKFQSLWYDELVTLTISSGKNISQVIALARQDTYPPLQYFITHFVVNYIGNSETMLRYPFALAGIVVIPFMFLLGRRLFSAKEGLMTAALTATLYCPVYFSQELRAYSLLLLFSVASVYFLLRITASLRKEVSPSLWVLAAYVGSALLCAYSHYSGLLFVFLQASFVLAQFVARSHGRKTLLIVFAAILLGYLPWVSGLLFQLHHVLPRFQTGAPHLFSFLEAVAFFFRSSPELLVVLIFFLLYPLYRSPLSRKEFLLALLLTGPFLLLYMLSKCGLTIFELRYLLISLPAAYLLAARGIILLSEKIKQQEALPMLLSCLLAVALISSRYYTTPAKPQHRETAAALTSLRETYPEAALVGFVGNREMLEYYLSRVTKLNNTVLLEPDAQSIERINAALGASRHPYFAVFYLNAAPRNDFSQTLKNKYQLIEEKEFVKDSIFLFRSN